jgi:hypothetical protein
MELILNSSQHTLNVSIPLTKLSASAMETLNVSLELFSDDFSCAVVDPSTAYIQILDDHVDDDDGEGMYSNPGLT